MCVRIDARRWSVLGGGLILFVGLLSLGGACFGDDGGGLLIDRETPRATQTPFIARSPVAGTPTATPLAAGTPTPGAEVTPSVEVAVTAVAEPFEVTVDEAVNVRAQPSTNEESTILGGIFPGERAKVVGEAHGQEAELGKGDLWYQVELTRDGTTVRGFVYAPLVEKVEE